MQPLEEKTMEESNNKLDKLLVKLEEFGQLGYDKASHKEMKISLASSLERICRDILQRHHLFEHLFQRANNICVLWRDEDECDNLLGSDLFSEKLRALFPNAKVHVQKTSGDSEMTLSIYGIVDLILVPKTVLLSDTVFEKRLSLLRPGGYLIAELNPGDSEIYSGMERDKEFEILGKNTSVNCGVDSPMCRIWRRARFPTRNFNENQSDIVKGAMVYLAYSSDSHLHLQQKNVEWMKSNFAPDAIISYCPNDICDVFYQKNKRILDQTRGSGYWLWKPYIIYITLMVCNAEYIIYCDSSSQLKLSKLQIINSLQSNNIYPEPCMLAFQLGNYAQEYKWSKRDCLYVLLKGKEFEMPQVILSDQIAATASVYRRSNIVNGTDLCLEFATEWLNYAQYK